MFMDDNDKLIDVAHRESAYLHDLGLFDASTALDELLKQRAELLEALKGMRDIWQSTCDAHNWDAHHMYQFTKCVAAITKAEAAE